MNSYNPQCNSIPVLHRHSHPSWPSNTLCHAHEDVYNPGGFNSAHRTEKYASGRFTGGRTWYTNAKELSILSVVQKLHAEELFNLTQVAQFIQIVLPVICRWAKKVEDLQRDPKKAGKMAFHGGPASLVNDIEQELLDFI
jgi:hypothetical protein